MRFNMFRNMQKKNDFGKTEWCLNYKRCIVTADIREQRITDDADQDICYTTETATFDINDCKLGEIINWIAKINEHPNKLVYKIKITPDESSKILDEIELNRIGL
jgi:hypothetical protein